MSPNELEPQLVEAMALVPDEFLDEDIADLEEELYEGVFEAYPDVTLLEIEESLFDASVTPERRWSLPLRDAFPPAEEPVGGARFDNDPSAAAPTAHGPGADDVLLLHQALAAIGIDIADDERDWQQFGPKTRQAISR